MKRLLLIDLRKLRHSRSITVLTVLYFLALGITASSGMEFLKYLKAQGLEFTMWDPTRIPLYHFPDILHKITYFALNFKFLLALIVIISITNEYSYRTIRQNVIDGLSRSDFLKSKLYSIVLLAIISTLFIFLVGLITGLIYSPYREVQEIVADLEFLPAYFLELLGYLVFTMIISILIQRSGLTIGLLSLYSVVIEPIIRLNLPDKVEFLGDFLPVNAFSNLILLPYKKYIFMEIQDYIDPVAAGIALAYIILFTYLSFRLMNKRDI